MLLARSRRLVGWIALLTAILAADRILLDRLGAPGMRIYYGPDTTAVGLLVGALLAAVRFRHGLRVGEWAGKVGVVALVVGALAGWQLDWATFGALPFEAATALLVAAAVSSTELARGLAAPPLVWLGKRSYSLYLWSGVVLWLIRPEASFWISRVIALPLAVAVAAASYSFVEQPFRRRLSRPERAVAAATP